MNKIKRMCLLILVVCLGLSAALPVLAEPEQATGLVTGCSTLDAQSSLAGSQKLLDTAKSAVLYELGSDTLIYGWYPDEPVDPSGMNKIMTALLALERGDPDRVVTVSSAALSSIALDAKKIGLQSGEEMTLRDLLYCMMVGSANDAAAVIAEHIGGAQDPFIAMMNIRAKELGCTNTMFMNPSGLSDERQYTTARDLAKITAAALELESFQEYFSAVSYTVPATNKSEERKLLTTNYMMSAESVAGYVDERVTGGKTGAFSSLDRSLICTATKGDVTYLSVVMSAQGEKGADGAAYCSFMETAALLDHGFDHYSLRRILSEGVVLEQFAVQDGENNLAVTPASTVYSMMPNDLGEAQITYRCIKSDRGIVAPVSPGQSVGTVQVWCGSLCVSESDLVAMHAVERPGVYNVSIPTSAAPEEAPAWQSILIVTIVILAVLLVLGMVVFIRRGKGKVR